MTAEPAHVKVFMEAWSKYALTLSRQMGLKGPRFSSKIGDSLDEEKLDLFSEEQLVQLFELYKETSKPVDTNTDPHLKL